MIYPYRNTWYILPNQHIWLTQSQSSACHYPQTVIILTETHDPTHQNIRLHNLIVQCTNISKLWYIYPIKKIEWSCKSKIFGFTQSLLNPACCLLSRHVIIVWSRDCWNLQLQNLLFIITNPNFRISVFKLVQNNNTYSGMRRKWTRVSRLVLVLCQMQNNECSRDDI